MNDDTNDLGFWRKAWSGIKAAVDLIGKVEALDSKMSNQEADINKIKLEQANIVGKLEIVIRWVENKGTTPSGSAV